MKLPTINYLPLIYLLSINTALADEMDDFFALSPAELAEITVMIASGTQKSVYHSPAVTTVITAQQIKSMGATQLNQVLETVPGLHVSIQAVTGDAVYSMRGMVNNVNAQVLVMLNGNRYSVPYKGSPMTGMSLPVEAIQKIEVIRGPGSALYGADAFAGVINIITKKAADINGTEVGVRGGSWDSQSVWGLHGSQWRGWDIAATMQYRHNTNDNQQTVDSDLQSRFDRGFGTQASLAPGAVQSAAENWNAHLNLQRPHWNMGFWAFNESNAGLRYGAAGALDNKGQLKGSNYLTHIQFSSEDWDEQWELTARASYLYTDIKANIHNFPDGAVLPIDQTGNINPTPQALLNPVFFPNGVVSNIGINNEVAIFKSTALFKGFTGHLWRATVAYRYEQVSTHEQRNFGHGILNGSEGLVDGTLTDVTGTDLTFLENSNRSIGSFALQDEWQISPDWQFTAGVRYDHYSDFGSTVNPRAALVWDIDSQLTAKLLYGEAFRAPSFLEQKQKNSQLFIGNPNLKPETIRTVELALDYRPFKTLGLGSNIYYYEIKDLITVAGVGIAKVNNTAGQSRLGVEVEWNWDILQQLNLKGNYAWQAAIDSQHNIRVPAHQVYLALAWRFLPQWQVQSQVNWVANRVNQIPTNQKLKDYATVDLTLNSQRFFNVVDLTASVHNLFNARGKEPANDSYPGNYPINSRSFYLETSVHF